jgi:hypothetical protein
VGISFYFLDTIDKTLYYNSVGMSLLVTKVVLMRKLKIIFLDIDGVMQSTSSMIRTQNRGGFLHEEHVNALNWIIEQTDAYVVMTSTYRIMSDMKGLKRSFMDSGVRSDRIVSKTPMLGTNRGREIKDWLDTRKEKGDYEIESYVVIDDGKDMAGIDWAKFINTDPDYGLTYVQAEMAVNLLNGRPRVTAIDPIVFTRQLNPTG